PEGGHFVALSCPLCQALRRKSFLKIFAAGIEGFSGRSVHKALDQATTVAAFVSSAALSYPSLFMFAPPVRRRG
ncbi:MAG TPA: hypothetical protein P5165_11845, partial [Spirochaetia bacterium]|nr:hypothetical protein [Spirochaetia bacterium]